MKKLLLILTFLVTTVGLLSAAETVTEVFKNAAWFTQIKSGNETAKTEKSTTTNIEYTYFQCYKNTSIGVMMCKNNNSYLSFKAPFGITKFDITVPGSASSNIKVDIFANNIKIKADLALPKGNTTQIDVPEDYQGKNIVFKIQKQKISPDDVNAQIESLTFTKAPEQAPSPEIIATYGEEKTPIEDKAFLDGIKVGTVFNFSAEKATRLVVTSNGTEIASGTDSATWTPTEEATGKVITVTATIDNENFTMTFTVNVVAVTLGDIVATYGEENTPIADEAELTGINAGTVFNFSAENATSLVVTDVNDTPIANGTNSATWTPTKPLNDMLTVTATLGEETKTLTFTVEVVAPTLGDIVATYGENYTPIVKDAEITVETGTTFRFSATNATNIKVEKWDGGEVVNENSDNVTWTVNEPFEYDGVTVTATDDYGSNPTTLVFFLTVIKSEKQIWKLVTAVSDLSVNGKYIIANSDGTYGMSNEYNKNYRQKTAITVEGNNLINPSDDVLRLCLEKDGDDYLWKTINYKNEAGEVLAANKQVYLNTNTGNDNHLYATNPQSGNENRRNTSVSFENDYALITFVYAFKDKDHRRIFYHTSSPRFSTYAETNTSMEKVRLYKLEEPEAPTIDQIQGDATHISVISTKGDLHVWTLEYDASGTLVKDNGDPVNAPVMVKAPAADDNSWTNKVADENVLYNVAVPEKGHYLTIRAKSVLNGVHSPEVVKNVDSNGGFISGVEAVTTDDVNAPVEYFNLQGMRVNADAPGLYIRRQGNKVEKVTIR